MIVYSNEKAGFLKDVFGGTIANIIEKNLYQILKRKTSWSEFSSWVNSLKNMYIVMEDRSIPSDAGVAIEYNIPSTGKRVDFIVTGYDDESHENMVIIELKQWSMLQTVSDQNEMVHAFTGGMEQDVPHPSYQAWTYARLIYDYNQCVQDSHIGLFPCAYLHNYVPSSADSDPLFASQYGSCLRDAPAYTGTQTAELREFIKGHIRKGDKRKILYSVDNGKISPSKSLQNCIASMMKGNREFLMIDDQKVAYEHILQISRACKKDGKKRTVIVKGGPGTGKTVIAVNLLCTLTQDKQYVQYTSKNQAPRYVYLKKLQGAHSSDERDMAKNLFKGSGVYYNVGNDVLDTILADEAHRLNGKTYSPIYGLVGFNQIKEIIHASKCSVFFIDEDQTVMLKDIGSIDEIKRWADEEHSEVSELELSSQFRCNGSEGYLSWLDNTLGIRETANYNLTGIDYDIRVFDTPDEVFSLIKQKNKIANSARMLAGYCWNWVKDTRNDPSVHDIVIGTFEKSWNLGNTETWAINPDSVEQIGCVHTSQGLEFDYVGVIIGDDLRYKNDELVTDMTKRAKTDQSLRIGFKKNETEENKTKIADKIIKDTYRILMSRGLKGCYVYCTDPGLSTYLKERASRT